VSKCGNEVATIQQQGHRSQHGRCGGCWYVGELVLLLFHIPNCTRNNLQWFIFLGQACMHFNRAYIVLPLMMCKVSNHSDCRQPNLPTPKGKILLLFQEWTALARVYKIHMRSWHMWTQWQGVGMAR